MTDHSWRIVLLVVSLVLFVLACVEEIIDTKKVGPLALMAGGLTVLDIMWLRDA